MSLAEADFGAGGYAVVVTVHVGGIEERDAGVEGGMHDFFRALHVDTSVESVAADTNFRDLQ